MHATAPHVAASTGSRLCPRSRRGKFAGVKSVQRVETHGGKAPSEPCDSSAAEQVVKVPYRATYAFAR